jgi:hypothetical protein
MSIDAIAIERTWFAISPDGAEHDVVLRIGVPTHMPEGEWRTAVSLGALESRTHAIVGIDPWQAVSLAMRFVATRVAHFAEDGWQFYWERGGELASPSELTNVP